MFETGIIACIVVLALAVINLVIASTTFLVVKHPSDSVVGWFALSGIAALVVGIAAAFILFPYQAKYWAWETKEGIVAETEFDAKADTSTRNGWTEGGLRIKLGDGTTFFTTDFRLAEKVAGEKVALVCKRSFQHGNVDRIDCKSQIGSL